MRITCPSCAAEYEVPASRLTPHRMVRCAQCGGEWAPHQDFEEPTPAADHIADQTAVAEASLPTPMQPLPQITAMDRLAARPPQPLRRRGLIAAWAATAIVLLAAVAAALLWRQAVVRAWPPSSRILGATDSAPATPPHPAGASPE